MTSRELRGLDIVEDPDGIEVWLWLSAESGLRHSDRRRAITGPTGCGIWCDGRMIAVREDVGRHNALDKIAGAIAADGHGDGTRMERSIVVMTSQVSVEMVQKAACMGEGCIAAVSAPTSLAVRAAQQAGPTLAAVHADGFDVIAHGTRILDIADDCRALATLRHA